MIYCEIERHLILFVDSKKKKKRTLFCLKILENSIETVRMEFEMNYLTNCDTAIDFHTVSKIKTLITKFLAIFWSFDLLMNEVSDCVIWEIQSSITQKYNVQFNFSCAY